MSGTHLPLLSIGTDPLDDPLNLGWDAIVRNEQPASSTIDPGDFDLLRRAHAQANRSLPDPEFFAALERQLAEMYSTPPPEPRQARVNREHAGTMPASPTMARPRLLPSRWYPVFAGLALLGLLMVIGYAVLLRTAPGNSEPPAIPAASVPEPFLDPVVQFDFEPGMLATVGATAWSDMEVSVQKLDPGKPFTTSVGWYLGGDGPLIVLVMDGELELTPGGTAYVFHAGHDPAQPERIEPGHTLTLAPQDAIVYSTQDGASGQATGDTQMVAFVGQVSSPSGIDFGQVESWDHGETEMESFTYNGYPLTPMPSDSAVVSVERLRLMPFDSFVFDPAEDFIYLVTFDSEAAAGLRVFDGAVNAFGPENGHASWKLQSLDPGPHTLFNLGDRPIDIYFLVLEPGPASGAAAP